MRCGQDGPGARRPTRAICRYGRGGHRPSWPQPGGTGRSGRISSSGSLEISTYSFGPSSLNRVPIAFVAHAPVYETGSKYLATQAGPTGTSVANGGFERNSSGAQGKPRRAMDRAGRQARLKRSRLPPSPRARPSLPPDQYAGLPPPSPCRPWPRSPEGCSPRSPDRGKGRRSG